MKFSLENNNKVWIFVVLVAALISFTFINTYPISILDEAKNAEAAREMWASGTYWVPKFNGELRTDKPPLHYYFMLLGFNPSLASALATVDSTSPPQAVCRRLP